MEQQPDLFELKVDSPVGNYLNAIAKWAKFLSIVGFVVCGLLVIFAFFASFFMAFFFSAIPGGDSLYGAGTVLSVVFTILFLLVALLYFFPCLYLYRFSVRMQNAIRQNDQQSLISSFANLKSWFKFIGILTIIMLSIYALSFLMQLISIAASR